MTNKTDSMIRSIFLFLMIVPFCLAAQKFRHLDYVGAGHTKEIKVSGSGDQQRLNSTIDGFEVTNSDQLKDASRFLAQCTFGADMSTIRMVSAMGKEAWLDEQFSLPIITMDSEAQYFTATYFSDDDEEEGFEPGEYSVYQFNAAWLHSNLAHPDILRKRLAFILSEIFVINTKSDLFEDVGTISTSFYDGLSRNAMTNYRTLIESVSLNPAMGMFLSHWNNPKADPANNIHPDENYAREIMQLFSIKVRF